MAPVHEPLTKGSTGPASSHELSANHHRLWKDAAYILALEPGLSEVQ